MKGTDQLFRLAASIVLEEDAKAPSQISYLESELVASLISDTGWNPDRVRLELKKQIADCAFEKTSNRTFDLHTQCLNDARHRAANTAYAPCRSKPDLGRSNSLRNESAAHEREPFRPH